MSLLLYVAMGLKKAIKKVKNVYNKVMDKQAELPYQVQKGLKYAWSKGRKKSETFNKFTKGVEKVKKGISKAYHSKPVKGVGKFLDFIEKVPIIGGEVADVRNFAKGVIKDPFAVKSNVLNLSKIALDLTPAGIEEQAFNFTADKAVDKLYEKAGDSLKKREKRAKERVNKKKKKNANGTTSTANINSNGLNIKIPNKSSGTSSNRRVSQMSNPANAGKINRNYGSSGLSAFGK